MKRRLKELLLLLFTVAVIGAAVVASGIVPIRASGGHLPITKWLLDFASTRSIATHSTGIRIPPLDTPGMVQLGAGIYESNCAWCHGRPGFVLPRVAAQMTPAPPDLAEIAQQFEANELFYVVRHGIKFAGMPAWPTDHRDDEVWPVVAFLQTLPNLSQQQYDQLIKGPHPSDSGVPVVVTEHCAQCHGIEGISQAGARVPRLAGQKREYLEGALHAYSSGQRNSGIMEPIAARLDARQIKQATLWYASQKSFTPVQEDLNSDSVASGKRIVHDGMPANDVPSCIDCHGPALTSAAGYPKLSGMPEDYLVRQLELFAEGHRGETRESKIMRPIADALTPQQRRDVAAYYRSLGMKIAEASP